MRRRPHRAPAVVLLAGTLLALLPLSGCRGAAAALGPDAAESSAPAGEVLAALAWRFGPRELEPRFEAARSKLVRASLLPSRVVDDLSLWTEAVRDTRAVEFWGGRSGGAYRVGVRPGVPAPKLPADYRGALRLRRLGPGDYEWRMREELAVGAVPAEALAQALTALFQGAERASEADGRPECRQALPRTAAALGRLISLDELRLAPSAEGGTAIAVGAALDPSGIEAAFPRYARFLRRHVLPLRFRAVALGDHGDRWWEAEARDGRYSLRLRVSGGDLAPLDGPPRPVPERLRVRVDVSTRNGPFRVGLRGLEADVALTRARREKAFTARFQRPPDWDLPFLVEPLLRSSLRRPFEGEGALLAYAVQDAPEGPTLLVRDYRIAVRESWIVRWLGGLVGSTVEEFRREAEAEADRFSAAVLLALREDVLALLPSAAEGRGEP